MEPESMYGKFAMNRLMQKFLEDDERAKNIIAAVGISAGIALLGVAMFAKFVLH
jgi:hypothetical protein